MKNTAVFCVCRNESKLLPLWVKYYGGIFGMENIYIFDDNTSDGTFDNLDLINYELLNLGRDKTVKRYGVHDYGTLWNFIVNKYIELFKEYKVVINADADDFIVPNLNKYENLKEFIDINSDTYFRCKAFEVLQMPEEKPIDWSLNILNQRSKWIRITNLDKTSVTRNRSRSSWVLGNHYVSGAEHEAANEDLLLIHLHRIDYDEYKRKYFIVDDRIKNNRDFESLYCGYPLFWTEDALNEHFYNVRANERYGAKSVDVEIIPDKYKVF